jgi:hypothetical protein
MPDIPTNFRRTLFVVDLRHPAQLVPGYSGRFASTSTAFLALGWNDFFAASINVLGYVSFFVPAYLYRLSIKSTCWLYLPLVYIASERDFAATPAHFVDRLIRGGWEWWRRILAGLTLIAFTATTLASISAQELGGLITRARVKALSARGHWAALGRPLRARCCGGRRWRDGGLPQKGPLGPLRNDCGLEEAPRRADVAPVRRRLTQ